MFQCTPSGSTTTLPSVEVFSGLSPSVKRMELAELNLPVEEPEERLLRDFLSAKREDCVPSEETTDFPMLNWDQSADTIVLGTVRKHGGTASRTEKDAPTVMNESPRTGESR